MYTQVCDMKKFTVEVSETEEKALLVVMVDIQEWIDNAIHNRARQAIDMIINDRTDKQAKKIPLTERDKIIKGLVLETAKERTEKLIAQLGT